MYSFANFDDKSFINSLTSVATLPVPIKPVCVAGAWPSPSPVKTSFHLALLSTTSGSSIPPTISSGSYSPGSPSIGISSIALYKSASISSVK